MKSVKNIIEIIKKYKNELQKQFGVEDIGVFGSYVRGDQKAGSDVDVLVQFGGPVGLLKFVRLERYLSDLIGAKVDLVMKSALKPRIGKRVLSEVRYI